MQGDKLNLGTFIREQRSRPHGTGLRVLVALVLASVSVVVPGSAGAAALPGSLSPLSSPFNCIGETTGASEGNTCGTRVTSGTHNAFQIKLSPDGRNAYSVAVNGDLIEYSRNGATGALTVIGCVTAGTDKCATENIVENAVEITDPTAIALSPDGKSAYVTAIAKSVVVEFERNTETGLLNPINSGKACITEEATGECEFKEAKGLHEPYGVTVSPDGQNVYVTAVKGEAVAELSRNTESGVLAQLPSPNECIGGPASACTTHSAIGMVEPIGAVVSPDGKNVYVAAGASTEEGAVVAFEREAGGALKQLAGPKEGCISEKISGCETAAGLQGSEDLVISPDEVDIYATSAHDNAIIELERTGEHGALKQLAEPNGCLALEKTGATTNCSLAKAIRNSRGVAISPEGDDVYVGSAGENSVAAFARSSETGALTQLTEPAACVTSNASGCGANEVLGMKETRRVVLSPDGTNVYVAGQAAGAIVELARAVTPTVTGVGPRSGSEAGGTGVTISGTGFVEGTTVKFGSASASNVQVNSGTSISVTAPAGAGTAEVTVTTPMGSSAKSSADRYFYALLTQPPGLLGGLGLAQYCKTAGFEEKVGLLKGEVEGPGFAFQNWACEGIKPTTLIAETGPAPSMEDACHAQRGAFSYGYAENPDSAFSWNCYEDPSVTGVSLAEGPAAGGSPVTITGTNFSPASTVEFGSISATKVTFNSVTSITATSPGGVGTVDVRVTTYNGTSATTAADKFTYIRPPSSSNKGGQPVAVISSSVVAPPVLAVSGNVAPVSGKVLVKLPGAVSFVPLTSLRNIPFGTIIEATHGKVTVTTANAHGAVQSMTFFEGQFRLTQGRNGLVVAELTGGNFSVCPTARERAHIASASSKHASPKHVVRKLWAEGHGSYSTKGNYAAGAVLGTRWLTEDLCDGTLIHVATDKVAVTNLVNHRHKTVKAGKSYLAKAP